MKTDEMVRGGRGSAPIFLNKQKYEVDAESMSGRAIKALGGYGDDYDIFLIQGEGDTTGSSIGPDQSVPIKPGLHFRALPGNRNFGDVAIHPDLASAIEKIRGLGYGVDVNLEGGVVGVVIHDFPLPRGKFNSQKTRLLLRAPANPDGAMDMFWTDPALRLANGAVPQAADCIQTLHGQQWRRFSWHYKAQWKPGRDNPFTYLAFVEDRFARGV